MGIDLKIQNPFCDSTMTIEGECVSSDVYKYSIEGIKLNECIVMYCSQRFIQNYLQYPPIDKITVKEKGVMLHLLLTSGAPVLFCEDNNEAFKEGRGRYNCIPYNQLEELYPKMSPDKIDMIIENFAMLYPDLGSTIFFGKDEETLESNINKLLFMPSDEKSRNNNWNIFQMLKAMGYIATFEGQMSTDGSYCYLTEKAWNRIEPLNDSYKSNKIFIAMSYSGERGLDEIEICIKEAVNNCGYKPVVIKDKEHNEYIPVEIETEIRKSAGVIADLTEHNCGVYYEAGLARGLKKQVIYTVLDDKEQKESTHFDVKQINTIFWKCDTEDDKGEFIKKLSRRIASTIGEYKHK